MKLQYLGTAAAEGFPAMFCRCDACVRARKLGGRNLRTRSQALIDGKLLIDFNPDSLSHTFAQRLDLTELRYVLLTHTHGDHFFPWDIVTQRRHGFMQWNGAEPYALTFCGSEIACAAVEKLRADYGKTLDDRIAARLLPPFTPTRVGDHTVTALPATHDPRSGPYIYVIADGEKTMLYGHDSSWYNEEVWAYMKAHCRFDYVSLDCTYGVIPDRHPAHMNLAWDVKVRARMLADGIADEKTIFCANHFTHNCLAVYDDIVPIAAKEDFIVSYDGMTVEF